MDDRKGQFVDIEAFKQLDKLEQERVSQKPALSIGEVVEIKGVKFCVSDILSRGRLHLKMLAGQS